MKVIGMNYSINDLLPMINMEIDIWRFPQLDSSHCIKVVGK